METSSIECRIILALRALENDQNLTSRAVAKIYKVPHTTLLRRRDGKKSRCDISANSRKLTNLEESVILRRILDLDSRGFQPRQSDIQEMADCLCTDRNASRVGPRWVENFVKRHPELTMAFRRQIDYQRAKCEDPKVVQAWFALVQNVIAKYGIQEADIYNFDETGFLMGMLSSAKVVTSSERRSKPRTKQLGNREWVTVIQGVCATGWAVPSYVVVKGKYHLLPWYQNANSQRIGGFIQAKTHTKARTKGVYRLLVLDGHESHHSSNFEDYCQENNIITLCMPPHSSHFLQPLDVGCFGPLKTSYGRQIEKMMRMQITHITKDDFFAAFLEAFNASITEKNIQAGFKATGLIPYNPESVITRLDPKPITLSPPTSRSGTPNSWVTKTPQTAYEVNQQSTTIKNKIAKHQDSSLTHMYTIIDAQARGMSKMAHELVLLRAELKDVRAANEVLSKRQRAKKARLRQGGSLSFQEAEDLVAENEVDKQIKEETHRSSHRTEVAEPRTRRCGICSNTGHNARTCQVVVVASEEDDSE
ncbi:hypothetical protein V500_06376 [Pseudogymnoascus sp. VKM F-4518 (FW-2643)]|nr:hypothetical protein V500_06376 [Pseudogymnoascus sp. VKM F-4518 (FW-2643)]